MTTVYCETCDSTGRVAEQRPGLSHFEPTEREVVCPEPGCKDGVLRVECDGGSFHDPCTDDAVLSLYGLDYCAACFEIAKRDVDDEDPPDHLEESRVA